MILTHGGKSVSKAIGKTANHTHTLVLTLTTEDYTIRDRGLTGGFPCLRRGIWLNDPLGTIRRPSMEKLAPLVRVTFTIAGSVFEINQEAGDAVRPCQGGSKYSGRAYRAQQLSA